MALLELKGLRKTYKKGDMEIHALDGIELSIERGEFLSIVGPSGSGKTTFLNIVGCLDLPSQGEVVYNNTALHTMSESQLSEYRKNNIAFIFQSYNLIPVLTALENVELPLILDKKCHKSEARKRALDVLSSVGLQGLENRFPRELSGGQEQRVAIARALVKKPLVVLADEPTANLDSKTAEAILSVMQDMNREIGTTFVFTTHDPRMEAHARRRITLKDGAIICDEKVEQ